MTRAERVAELRGRALDFRRRGLPRFATECDRLAAALDQPMPPGHVAVVVCLPDRRGDGRYPDEGTN